MIGDFVITYKGPYILSLKSRIYSQKRQKGRKSENHEYHFKKTNTRDGSRTNLRLRSELEAEREKNDALEARIALLVNNTNDVNDEITHLRATITSKF